MKNILVIGATGQIGSELTLELRKRYGDDHVVAGYIPSAMPKGESIVLFGERRRFCRFE